MQARPHRAPEKEPGSDELLSGFARRLLHDVNVRGVEAERGGGGPVSDQVDPEQLHGDEILREAQRGRQKDGGHLADVGGDHVADERLHVVVDGAALLHRGHLRHPLPSIKLTQHMTLLNF